MSKEAMKLALEALVYASSYCDTYDAITALREALAEQPAQQEPVKWSDYEADGMHHNKPVKCKYPKCGYPCPDLPDCRDAEHPTTEQSLAVQPAQRTWEEWFKWWRTSKVADSTEAEIDFADFMLIVRAVESEYGIKEST